MAALVVSGSAFAQEAAGSGAGGEVGAGVSTFGAGDWFGLIARLALVVLVIWAAVAGMRWYVRRVHQGGRAGGLGALEVVETHALGPNRTLHLVRLGDRAVLVGATPERITSLMSVDDPEELKRLVDRPQEVAPGRAAAGGLASLVSSLGTGLVAMNARRREVNARAREQRTADRAQQAQQVQGRPAASASSEVRARRFGALRAVLARAAARPAADRSVRASRRRDAAAEPESRQSLFERTLASIEAAEVRGAPTAAGLRARSGYGQAPSASTAPSASSVAPAGISAVSRDAQIAELQRAIAVARRNAG
ncbi:MAG: flagellar biosynthetic protein FliO [Dehalococcoidia bacterium]|nr:flagellar biosynthetic protein FliO [Dehalococcoidia bacterium]